MGCIASKSDINDAHPNVFVVYNIDDASNKVSEGHLEVTDSHILLHQKGKDPVRWPLKSLRRYGAEGEIFSFESGRKCETGPGIYAFRCARADRLLALLQDKVRSNSNSLAFGDHTMQQQQQLHRSEDSLQQHQSSALTPAAIVQPQPPQIAAAVAAAAVVIEEDLPMPEYANVNCSNGGKGLTLEASDGYLVPNTPVSLTFANGLFHNCDVSSTSSSREYENVGGFLLDHSITLLQQQQQPPLLPVFFRDEVAAALNGETHSDIDGESSSPQINYIAVDFEAATVIQQQQQQQEFPLKSPPFLLLQLPNGNPPPSTSEPEPELRGEYCTIDIDRTQALSHTARQQGHRGGGGGGGGEGGAGGGAGTNGPLGSPVGVRKTRHNSSLSELTSVGMGFGAGAKRNSVIGGGE